MGYRVLVKLIPDDSKVQKEEKTASGIVIAVQDENKIDRQKRATQEARIIALGPLAFSKSTSYEDSGVKVGDKVMICRYSGDDLLDIEDKEIYRLINDTDVECVYEGE